MSSNNVTPSSAGTSGVSPEIQAQVEAMRRANEAKAAEEKAAKAAREAKRTAKAAAAQPTVPGEPKASISSSAVLANVAPANESASPVPAKEIPFDADAAKPQQPDGIIMAPGAVRSSTPGELALLESMARAQDDFKALPPEQREAHAKASGFTSDSYALLEQVSREFVMVSLGRVFYAYERETGVEHCEKGFCQIVRKRHGCITPLDPEADEKQISLGKVWWECDFHHKRTVTKIVLEPTRLSAGEDADQRPEVLNLWHVRKLTMCPPDMSATKESIIPLLEHLTYLADGDQVVVWYFLNWLATLYQRPEIKIPSGFLFYSRVTGVGKSMLYKLLAPVFGRSMVGSCSGRALTKSFDDVIEHKRLLMVNEMTRSEKADSYETLKNMISEEDTSFEGKGRAAKDIVNICHFIITTNHNDALPLAQGDRRMAVFKCEADRKHPDYYVKLLAWVEGPGPALLAGVLANWKFEADWNPYAPVPQTSAAKELQNIAQGPLFTNLKEMREARVPPFDKDAFTADQVADVLLKGDRGKQWGCAVTSPAVGKALGKMGWEPWKGKVKHSHARDSATVQVYLMTPSDDWWRVLSPEDRGAYLESTQRLFNVQNQPGEVANDE